MEEYLEFCVSDEEDENWPFSIWLDGESLAPFRPSSPEAIKLVLELAGVTDKDVVYDLGCGDGRICIAAAKLFGAKAVGSCW